MVPRTGEQIADSMVTGKNIVSLAITGLLGKKDNTATAMADNKNPNGGSDRHRSPPAATAVAMVGSRGDRGAIGE